MSFLEKLKLVVTFLKLSVGLTFARFVGVYLDVKIRILKVVIKVIK